LAKASKKAENAYNWAKAELEQLEDLGKRSESKVQRDEKVN
jgi:hypothetical protein